MTLRVIGLVLLVLLLPAGFALIGRGDVLIGLRQVVAGLLFMAFTWISPYSPWSGPLFGLSVIVFPAEPVSLVLGAAILFWIGYRRLKPIELDPLLVGRAPHDAVMGGAERFVEEFERMGWFRAGALSARLGRTDIIMACLLSADGRAFAEVTDVVLTITSVFGDGRTLVTRNSATAPLPETALANDLRGAGPSELAAAHRRALGLLTEHGESPRELRAGDDLVDFIIDQEIRSIENARGFRPGLLDDSRGFGSIDTSIGSLQRIQRWQQQRGPGLADGLLA